MSRKIIYSTIKKKSVNIINEKEKTIHIYKYPNEEIKIVYDKYNRRCGIILKSKFLFSHFPKIFYVRKIRFYYNENGFLSKKMDLRKEHKNLVDCLKTKYVYDSNENLKKIQRSFFEENTLIHTETEEYQNVYGADGTLERVYRILSEGNICKTEISYSEGSKIIDIWDVNSQLKYKIFSLLDGITERFEFYLPSGELSYLLIKRNADDGKILYEMINPMNGLYCWKLLSQERDIYLNGDTEYPIMRFEIKIYEPILTSKVFLEIIHYLKEKSDMEIYLEILGDWYCVPQHEAELIHQISIEYNINYFFLV